MKFFNRFNNIILCELFIYVRKYITLHIKREFFLRAYLLQKFIPFEKFE